MGEQELATTLDFSRVGRVNAMLARRLELLAEVQYLTDLSDGNLSDTLQLLDMGLQQ